MSRAPAHIAATKALAATSATTAGASSTRSTWSSAAASSTAPSQSSASQRHFFHRLSAYNDRLREWLGDKDFWRKPVLNWALGWIEEGLKDRAITRDVTWGVRIPVEGWDDKRIYVWFEAVIGYLSAAMEWAERSGEPEAWRALLAGPRLPPFTTSSARTTSRSTR